MPASVTEVVVISPETIDDLFAELARDGFTTVGPTVEDDVIRYRPMSASSALPIGVTDNQAGGEYRLHARTDNALFGFSVGPDSAKAMLFPPRSPVFSFDTETSTFTAAENQTESIAIIGVKPCELAAIEIQDRVLLNGPHPDPAYRARRERLFLVAVNCVEAGATCFCDSMGSGPRATSGYDIVLTEIYRRRPSFRRRGSNRAGRRHPGTLAFSNGTRKRLARGECRHRRSKTIDGAHPRHL